MVAEPGDLDPHHSGSLQKKRRFNNGLTRGGGQKISIILIIYTPDLEAIALSQNVTPINDRTRHRSKLTCRTVVPGSTRTFFPSMKHSSFAGGPPELDLVAITNQDLYRNDYSVF